MLHFQDNSGAQELHSPVFRKTYFPVEINDGYFPRYIKSDADFSYIDSKQHFHTIHRLQY
jgi:hypothetical protein